jgi:hypothetical protein
MQMTKYSQKKYEQRKSLKRIDKGKMKKGGKNTITVTKQKEKKMKQDLYFLLYAVKHLI